MTIPGKKIIASIKAQSILHKLTLLKDKKKKKKEIEYVFPAPLCLPTSYLSSRIHRNFIGIIYMA